MLAMMAKGNSTFVVRCRRRIIYGVGIMLLGAVALVLALYGSHAALFAEDSFQQGFYTGLGGGLLAAGLLTIIRNAMYLRSEEARKKREVYENDERNRLLGLRTWAHAGVAFYVVLYLAVLVSGLWSVLVMKTLLVVMAVFALLLLAARLILQKKM